MLLGLQVISAYAEEKKDNQVATVPSNNIEKALNESDKAIQGLGDLLIKKGLLSPWLEQMRDTQKALNELESKNKLGIRDKAFATEGDRVARCKERKNSENAPSKDPMERELDELMKQRDPLIEQIISKKNADISELIALNDKIEQTSKKFFQKISSEEKNAPQAVDKSDSSPEYKALLKKLKALSDILLTAETSKGLTLNQPIADVLASPEAKQYVDILTKRADFQACEPDLDFIRRDAKDEYGSFIGTTAWLFSMSKKEQKKVTK